MEETVVLVVDQDEKSRLQTAEFVRGEFDGISVLTANSVATAMDVLANQSVDVVVTGYNFTEGNGLELADHVREASPSTGCILYTHSESVETASFEDVVVEFVGKETPDAEQTLAALIEQAGPEQTQAAHPVPDSEQERLQATERILGLRGELAPALEELTAVAVDHFDVSSATITLVLRDRQEPLADTGAIDLPTVREDSLVTHTIVTEGGVMAVADTQSDPRFSENEEIQATDITSYLGATIETADGYAVGALSVYNDGERRYTETDRSYIRRLATLAGEIITLAEGGDGNG